MANLVTLILAAISSFIATNLDDLIILMVFFSQVGDRLRPQQIILGQYFGFTTLILLSLPGFFGGAIIPKNIIGLLGILPIIIGIKQLLDKETEEGQNLSTQTERSLFYTFLLSWLNPQILKIAAVTFANGGDNIAIYLSFFASLNLWELIITLGIFFVLVGCWCAFAYLLTLHPTLGKIFNRYGKKLAPWVLIGLGIYILKESL
jgi:cadmium resistance transport/sequestration family protein